MQAMSLCCAEQNQFVQTRKRTRHHCLITLLHNLFILIPPLFSIMPLFGRLSPVLVVRTLPNPDMPHHLSHPDLPMQGSSALILSVRFDGVEVLQLLLSHDYIYIFSVSIIFSAFCVLTINITFRQTIRKTSFCHSVC